MGCGICGYVGDFDRELLTEMCAAIKHRGPDSTGYFVDKGVGLGIDRLRIIDLVTGDQPIHNEDGTVWVVLNGEIYNYVELRTTLESLGHRFYTSSDTETIVHSYEEWGDACVQRLRGMFAFAVWDSTRKKLYFARDRLGKKPLFYALLGDGILFASEMKSILRSEAVSRQMDYAAMDYYFSYMYVPSPLTIFKSIRKLPPAHYGVFQGQKLSTSRYWDIQFESQALEDEGAVADMLYSKMYESVKIRMRSDVPVGAFLSGGVDSSTVVSMMCKLSNSPVRTVSIGFDEGTSELHYAKLVADSLQTNHKEYVVTPSAYELLPQLVAHFDEPFADHSFIPTYYLSKVTRNEVTVALSGDGGDELFMGYSFLQDPRVFGLYSKVPRSVRRPLLKAIRAIPGDTRMKRMASEAYDKDYGGQTPIERYGMRVSSLDRKSLGEMYSAAFRQAHPPLDPYEYLFELAKGTSSTDPLDVNDYVTMKSYLSEGILTKVDRMSMAVSLEVRSPLLDQELVELVARVPSSMKVRSGVTKYIFKKMAVERGLIPKEIAYRKKQGFGAPMDAWMRGGWGEFASQALDPVVSKNYTGIFDKERVKHLLEDPFLNSNRIFALIVFVTWYRSYIENNPEPIVAGPLAV